MYHLYCITGHLRLWLCWCVCKFGFWIGQVITVEHSDLYRQSHPWLLYTSLMQLRLFYNPHGVKANEIWYNPGIPHLDHDHQDHDDDDDDDDENLDVLTSNKQTGRLAHRVMDW